MGKGCDGAAAVRFRFHFLMQIRVLFLTVMPSPYQRQLFKAMNAHSRLQLRVLYLTDTTPDRNWIAGPLSTYEEVLPGRTLSWLSPSAHFNRGITHVLSSNQSDIFVLNGYFAPTTQIAMRILNHQKKRWVFWGEVPGYRQRGWVGSALRAQLQQPIAKGAIAVAAIGSRAVGAYKKRFPEIQVFDIPYFCDLSPFKVAAAERQAENKRSVDVLFSGQLIKRKGVDVLIKAFAQISDRVPELHLKLLGTGPSCNAFMDMIPLGLRDRVHFLGFQQTSKIPKIFASADIFVLPSRHDGWGVVVNEALGSGLPIVVSERVGACDLVEDDVNGFITVAGSVDNLADVLFKLAHSKSLRQTFGRSSADMATKWDVNEGVRRWLKLFDYALNE